LRVRRTQDQRSVAAGLERKREGGPNPPLGLARPGGARPDSKDGYGEKSSWGQLPRPGEANQEATAGGGTCPAGHRIKKMKRALFLPLEVPSQSTSPASTEIKSRKLEM